MSAESVKHFRELIESGFIVSSSRYEDQNGEWAKDVEFVDRVRVKMSEGTTLFMTIAEVKSLTREERLAIDIAPSDTPSLFTPL